jgi:hypothetical protein
MPEDDLSSQTLPENPALNSPANESVEPANSTAKTSVAEKIRHAASNVFQKHGVKFRAGRGRPRKDGSLKASDVVLPTEEQNNPVLPAVVNPTHDALFTRSIASVVKGTISFVKTIIRGKAKQAGIDETFTEKALKECEVEPEVFADFNESLGIVLEKYNAKTEYAPEVALTISALRIGAPFAALLKTFNDEIKRKNAAEKSSEK